MVYTDSSGQHWDCREEADLADAAIVRERRQQARLLRCGAERLAAAQAKHDAIVAEQRCAIDAALAANPPVGQAGHRDPVKVAAEACAKYAARLADSSMREELRG